MLFDKVRSKQVCDCQATKNKMILYSRLIKQTNKQTNSSLDSRSVWYKQRQTNQPAYLLQKKSVTVVDVSLLVGGMIDDDCARMFAEAWPIFLVGFVVGLAFAIKQARVWRQFFNGLILCDKNEVVIALRELSRLNRISHLVFTPNRLG